MGKAGRAGVKESNTPTELPPWLAVGAYVEVRQTEEGLRGSWATAKVNREYTYYKYKVAHAVKS